MATMGSDNDAALSRRRVGALRRTLPYLSSISLNTSDEDVAQMADDVSLSILLQLTGDDNTQTTAKSQITEESKSVFFDNSVVGSTTHSPSSFTAALLAKEGDNLQSSSPAMRAFGIHNISHTIKTSNKVRI
jgi:hypothetical protein